MQDLSLILARPGWRVHERGDDRVHVFGAPANERDLVAAALSSDIPAIAEASGHWAVIVEQPDRASLISDNIRSFPVFACAKGSRIVVSDSVEFLRDAVDDGGLDPTSVSEFTHQGFVSGPETLFRGIRQLQAAQILAIDSLGTITSRRTRQHHFSGVDLSDDHELDARFTEALTRSMDVALEQIGDRQIALPLSGGLDSRLLALELKERGIDNVIAFTYGVGETREVGVSREVARSLGLPWSFAQHTPEDLRNAWSKPETAQFLADSYSASALPHIQDWYALQQLRDRGDLAPNAVVIPGHCVVSRMHNEDVLDQADTTDRRHVKREIFEFHASIHSGAERLWRNPEYQAKLDRFLDEERYDGTPLSRLTVLQNYNYNERQTKYIYNSVRSYEHFGFGWAMPLLDAEMFNAWSDFSPEAAKDRDWFRRYVNGRFDRAAGVDVPEFAPMNVSEQKRNAVKRVLRAVGLLTAVERRLALRTIESHPMGFQSFLGTATPNDLRREVLRGGTQMGLHTEQFLADTWAPGSRLFHREE